MAKISLIDLLGGSIAQINSSFTLIKNVLNNKVLWRDNPAGEPNQMLTTLDMNNRRILNLPAPISDHEPVRRIDVATSVGDTAAAVAAAIAAAASADAAAAALISGTASIAQFSTTAGASLIGFIQPSADAVATNLQKKSQENVSVYDFMTLAQSLDSATGNPTLDATTSLQKATDFLASKGGGTVNIPGVILLKGSGGVITGRVVDGVKLKSNVSYRGTGVGEVRLHSSCVVGFTTRILNPVTALSAAPHDINFDDLLFTRPNSTWNPDLENTALLYVGAVNRMKVRGCRFVGWAGDAFMLGANDTPDLTALYETYVRDVEVTGCFFDGVTKANRQAISIFDGVDVNIHHNTFTRTTRSADVVNPMPGAVDIEPILASAKIANIRIEDNVFDDIGGVTGVVSFALGVPLTSPAHDLTVKNNTFRNISNVADVYAMGLSATNHSATAPGSPYMVSIVGNTHDPLAGTTTNRRYFTGGINGLTIEDNQVYGANGQMLIGYDDGTSHWPIDNLVFNDNEMRGLDITGGALDPAIVFFGGIHNGKITGNQFIDCGNLNGSPQNMTVLGFVGNGVQSKNIELSDNQFVNSAGFFTSSVPIYAGTLPFASTFKVRTNTFHGLNSTAYNSPDSIYAQVPCDLFDGFVTIASTTTPSVGGAKSFIANTGDTFTNFRRGQSGQEITILATDSGCVISNNANIKTLAGVNLTLAAGKLAKFVNFNNVWYQLS